MDYSYEDIAGMIDHSLLPPALNEQELEAGCELAVEYGVASVCIMPYYLKRCAEILQEAVSLPARRLVFHTVGIPRHSSVLKQNGHWRTVARNWTWLSIFRV